MKKKVKIIIIILLIIIAIPTSVGAYHLYDYLKHKDDCCSPCGPEEEVCMDVCARCD